MIRVENKKRFALFVLGVVFLISGIVFGAYEAYKFFSREKTVSEMSFSEAGKNGEKKTYQALIKISKIGDSSGDDVKRGDIVMTAPEDKEWSVAEKEGFLIIKISLTSDQANLLVQPKEEPAEKIRTNPENEEPSMPKQIAARRFAVDLSKIGISEDEVRGKVISDKVFDGEEVIIEKK